MTVPTPPRGEVLEGLRQLLADLMTEYDCEGDSRISAAIAYLETDRAEALAEDFAARMVEKAEVVESGARTPYQFGRGAGLREAARMLRDKERR